MKPAEFESRMRELEYFHSIRLIPGVWPIIRVDGRSFSRFTESRFEKPFDSAFRDLMLQAAEALLKELQGIYAYTESDEISLLLPRDWGLFDRELEKAVSISASVASAAFSLGCGVAAHFDSRVCLAVDSETVVDYFRWRQDDAARCALNGWCYWTLRQAGSSVKDATAALDRTTPAEKNEILFQHGINFNNLPLWQRRGIGLRWETYEKDATNPRTREPVKALRRRIKVDSELPMKDEYGVFLRSRIAGAAGNAPDDVAESAAEKH